MDPRGAYQDLISLNTSNRNSLCKKDSRIMVSGLLTPINITKKRLLGCAAALAFCAASPVALAEDTGTAITNADQHPGDWMSYGRTYSEQRYSPLDQITRKMPAI